jgi:hypothetical protein
MCKGGLPGQARQTAVPVSVRGFAGPVGCSIARETAPNLNQVVGSSSKTRAIKPLLFSNLKNIFLFV